MSFLSLIVVAFICTLAIHFFPPKIRWSEKKQESIYANQECAEAYQQAFADAELEHKSN